MKPFFTESDLCSFDGFYERSRLRGKYPSTVRISTGIASNFADVQQFVAFARTFLDRSAGDMLLSHPSGHLGNQRRDALAPGSGEPGPITQQGTSSVA